MRAVASVRPAFLVAFLQSRAGLPVCLVCGHLFATFVPLTLIASLFTPALLLFTPSFFWDG